jgi:Cu(I)/Ag(I) efflux system membrane protein CusA/SilA
MVRKTVHAKLRSTLAAGATRDAADSAGVHALKRAVIDRTAQYVVDNDLLTGETRSETEADLPAGETGTDNSNDLHDTLRQIVDDKLHMRSLPLRKLTMQELMYDDMDKEFQFIGLTNAWIMPIKTRIDMLSTGIKTPIGIKIFGDNLRTLEALAIEVEEAVKKVPGTLSAVAERVMGGNYIDFDIDRREVARYGLTVGDVQDVIETAVGGMNVTHTTEGRYRFPVNIRYPRELRDDPEKLGRVLVHTPRGGQVPMSQLASIDIKDGPPGIKSENALLQAIVYVDLQKGQDIGGYVDRARLAVERSITLPPGYYLSWSGQYEYMIEVNKRLRIVIPITLLIIFLLLYFNFGRITETLIVMLSLPFAVVGGI